MSLIDKATAHFASKERRELHIPQWDVTVYARSVTMEDKSRWLKKSQGDNTEYILYAVIDAFEDEHGNPCFTLAHKPKLKKGVDPDIVSRMFTFLMEDDQETEEDREKN